MITSSSKTVSTRFVSTSVKDFWIKVTLVKKEWQPAGSASCHALAFASMQNSKSDDFIPFVADDNVVLGDLAVGCVGWLLEVDV